MFTRNEGLSGEDITAIFEDRDGIIWVGTFNGLDRFSETPVQTYTERDGLWSSRVVSVTTGPTIRPNKRGTSAAPSLRGTPG